MMENLEEVAANVAHRTWILVHQIEVFTGDGPGSRTRPFEDERILEVPFSRHHSIDAGLLDAPLDVSNAANVAVGKDWNTETVANCFNNLPVSYSRHWSLHLSGPTMHSDYLGTSSFQHLRVLNSLSLVFENSDFASYRYCEVLVKRGN